ncbi:MAG: carboxypeptidase-like regulatory domain-containing protein [Williamsia sp.]|nr:carboxypeptidase-like regulatory domain-containing protein [Williamsia sp.]
MAETPTYNYQDIARYLQRNMTPQEMHLFERALMDDPFLADALEGFRASDATLAATHLDQLEQQITGEREETKVVPLIVKKKTWWKAAAMILFLAGAGSLSYFFLSKQEVPANIAQNKNSDSSSLLSQRAEVPAPEKKPAKSEAFTGKDSAALYKARSFSSRPHTQAAPAPAAPEERKEETIGTALAGRTPGIITTDSLLAGPPVSLKAADIDRIYQPLAKQTLNEFKGKVTDKKGEPVPFASITESKTRTNISSDANGDFVLKDPDSVVNVTVNSVGYLTAKTTLSAEKPGNIALEKNGAALSEVVIVGYGTQKKKALTGAADSSAAEPVGGWKNFGQYLNRQIDSLQTAQSKDLYISEDVVLEFSVDREGNPSDIKAPEHTNKEAASKAVQILTKGPRWRNKKKDKKVQVVIPFGAGK